MGVYIQLLIHTFAMSMKTFVIAWDQLRCLRRKRSPPSLLASSGQFFNLLVTPRTLVGQKFVEVEQQVTITWCKFGTLWRMLLNSPPETVRSPTSFLVMHISHAFFEQRTPGPHIPFINCFFIIHLLQQSSL